MPPVPKVALARPGRVHPWPTSDACWSPAIPAMGGRPGSSTASPATPVESTMVGSMEAGIRSSSKTAASHAEPSRWTSPVTPAFDASLICNWPSDRVQATQESTVPKASSPRSARERSGSNWSRMAATLVAEALGANRNPLAWSSRQVPTVRRSCQPMPGPIGSPVARSHTMVDARWLAMPTASTGPPSASERPATSRTASAIAEASNSTSPGNGVSGNTWTWWTWCTDPSASTMAPRTPEVPTSTTRRLTAGPPEPGRPRPRAAPARPARRTATGGRACRG